MVRKAIAVLVAVLILAVAGLATGMARTQAQTVPDAGTQSALQTARSLYENGDYQLAARAYRQVVDQGYADVSLYHNMGLAYFGAGELGQALWSLRSAEQLAPRDPDITNALIQVRRQLALHAAEGGSVDSAPKPVVDEGGLAQGLNLAASWLTMNELALVAFALWILFAALMALYWLGLLPSAAQRPARAARIMAGIALVAVVMALGGRMLDESHRDAVVVADQVEIFAGPGKQYPNQVALAAGSEVTLLDQRQNWTKVSTGEYGVTGWAQTETVREIGLALSPESTD